MALAGGAAQAQEMAPLTYTDQQIAQMSEQDQLTAIIAMSLQQVAVDAARSGEGPAGRAAPVPEFLCKICYMNDDQENAITLRCGHRWHKECLLGLLQSKVADAQTLIHCPDVSDEVDERALLANGGRCTHVIGKPTIFALAAELGDASLPAQYARWEDMARNPDVRECPVDGCGHRQIGDPRRPQMTCEKCAYEYCFVHSAAHPGETCRAYERRQRATDSHSNKVVAGQTLPCPWCTKPTTKQGGCNHMTCVHCKKDWCWVCGSKVKNTNWHYR